MSGDTRFFEQFIEDYFAECDEHLVNARRVLLALEAAPRDAAPPARLLHELFRGLHTLKGLSGMVGLASAEGVAHAMEDALREAQRRSGPLDRELLDLLFSGADLLERCVAARRRDDEPPPVGAYLAELERRRPPAAPDEASPAPSAAPAGVPAPTADLPMPDADAVVHHFEFAPSRELAARGVGVEAIRARLQALGVILEAKPRIVDGGIVFDFWVAVPRDRAPDADWARDGLAWTSTADAAAPAGEAPPEPAEAGRPAAAIGANVVRVDLARLDEVMRFVGELVTTRARFEDLLDRVAVQDARLHDELRETGIAMERQLRSLREGVMRIRLVPVGEVFERLRFAVRDIARETGKEVEIELRGQDTAIDKVLVDRMLEPLLHLVRNAVSHGIEPPAERRARGKPEAGRLSLRAAAAGDRILIDVEDDGAGVELERVAARARERGPLGPGERLAPDALLDVLCAPGFSTRSEADLTSGRGVGMDVVRSTVRELGGELALVTAPGRGARFTIDLPLTLLIVDALLVEVGGQQMAVPQQVLREVLRVEADAVTPFENNEVIPYRGGVLPILGLRRVFNLPDARSSVLHLLVVGTDAAPTGLLVDRLVGLREIVVHPVSDPLVAVPGIGGATQLGDGRVSLVLDSAALVRLARERRTPLS